MYLKKKQIILFLFGMDWAKNLILTLEFGLFGKNLASDEWIRGGVESNRTNFVLIFIEFFELFFTFRINRIINFRIERISNESSIWKIWLHPIVGVESNEFRINFHRIFRTFFALSNQLNRKFSNWTNFERIPIWLHP